MILFIENILVKCYTVAIACCGQCVTKQNNNGPYTMCRRVSNNLATTGCDNISAEHVVYGGLSLHVHLCLLFTAMLQHCYVPKDLVLV